MNRTVRDRTGLDWTARDRTTLAGTAPSVGRDAVRGELSIRATDASHRTRLTGVRSAFPLALRRTGAHRVHLVGTGAWPLGGDAVRLAVEVGPHAQLELTTVAASVALPGRSATASRFEVDVRVAEGGSLALDLGTTILAAGCDHLARVDVRLGDGARFTHRELLVQGRDGEQGGDGRSQLHVVGLGGAIVREQLACSRPDASPLVDGGARAVGSVVAVGEQPSPVHPGRASLTGSDGAGAAATSPLARRAAILDLPVAGWRAVAVGSDVASIDGWLAHAWSEATSA